METLTLREAKIGLIALRSLKEKIETATGETYSSKEYKEIESKFSARVETLETAEAVTNQTAQLPL